MLIIIFDPTNHLTILPDTRTAADPTATIDHETISHEPCRIDSTPLQHFLRYLCDTSPSKSSLVHVCSLTIFPMAQKPTYIDLGPKPDHFLQSGMSSLNQHSPRITHVAGDIPPAMSPLDAFAAQSRLLAKQLDDSRRNGRRVSRLPPLTVANSLARPRPGYFRSASTDTEGSTTVDNARVLPDDVHGSQLEVEEPSVRPRSYYPRLSRVLPTGDSQSPYASPSALANDVVSSKPPDQQLNVTGDYFGAARTQSPETTTSVRMSMDSSDLSSINKSQSSFDSYHHTKESLRDLSIESVSSRGQYVHDLQPPKLPYAQQTPSIRSIAADSSDDENLGSTPGSSISHPQRKVSSASGFSMPQSPLSPLAANHRRSTSTSSEHSVNGHRLSLPKFNFSRPLSRGSRISIESSSRQPSSDRQARSFYGSVILPPVSVHEKDALHNANRQLVAHASSYIYAKYSLPRGRMLEPDTLPRDDTPNLVLLDSSTTPENVESAVLEPTTSKPLLPITSPSLESQRSAVEIPNRRSMDQIDTRQIRPAPMPIPQEQYRHSMTSMNSGSTIKASKRTVAASTEPTAEDHLTKGIDCHERGSLKESTYHLRIAAKKNNPTAMLLYALACRHGWGMRQSPQEGVQWLRKAMKCSSIELENDNNTAVQGNQADFVERKTRRAQFALSVYELGISHMNGWGIEQDKVLALRCFEIASDWGDADAMAEAGFCYYQGVGCKKDLKKAAKFYRDAEARGMSMVGNSWYVRRLGMIDLQFLTRCLGSTRPNMRTTPVEDQDEVRRTPAWRRSLVTNRGHACSSEGRNRSRTDSRPCFIFWNSNF